jgi:hypothetical protein
MALINEPLMRVIKFAQAVGIFDLIVGLTVCAVAFGNPFERSLPQWPIVLGVGLLLFALPGALLLLLARRLDKGSVAAFYGIATIACLQAPIGGGILAFALGCCSAVIAFIYLGLGASCLIAWPHARRLSRQDRMSRLPVTQPAATGPLATPPPPRATSLRGARRR